MANYVLLRPLPFQGGASLLRLFKTWTESTSGPFSPAEYLYLKSSAASFASVASYNSGSLNIGEQGKAPEVQPGLFVSANFLSTLGARPYLGSDFAPDACEPGKGNVVLIKKSYWESRFGGDPAIIGKTLRIGGENLVVIGIMPAEFDTMGKWGAQVYLRPQTIWATFPAQWHVRWFNLFGRLRPGIGAKAAQAEMSALAARMAADHPGDERQPGIRLTDLRSSDVDVSDRRWYWLTTAMASLVLVIACANLAAVQLARAMGRSKEFAVRAALGASRIDLMVPLLVESATLSFAGCGAGILVAHWANAAMSKLYWEGRPIPIDARVLAFAAGAALATGFLFGMAPAWIASRVSSGDALKDLSRSSTSGRAHRRLKLTLVMIQVALAFVLVSATLSFGAGVRIALHSFLDWRTEGLFSGWMGAPQTINTDAQKRLLIRQLHDGLDSIPGVSAVLLSSEQPFYDYYHTKHVFVSGVVSDPNGVEEVARTVEFEPGLFPALGLPVVEGRLFSDDIKPSDPKVAVINEAMAKRFWPGASALGKKVRIDDSEDWCEVIGVVGDVRISPHFASPVSRFQIYRSLAQYPSGAYGILLRSPRSPGDLSKSVREAIARINPDISLSELGGVADSIRSKVDDASSEKIVSLGAFALVGLLEAMVGLYHSGRYRPKPLASASLTRFR
jgi:putative ABC transport system permease protein